VPDEEGTEETPNAAITPEMAGAAPEAAVDQAIGIARRTGARVDIVHLSSAAALDRCHRARAAGLPGSYPPGPGAASSLASPRSGHLIDSRREADHARD
jgi:hypothetical protein